MASELSSLLATSHDVDAVSSLDESLGDEESSSSVAEGSRQQLGHFQQKQQHGVEVHSIDVM